MFDENFSFLSSTSNPYPCVSIETSPSSPDLSPFSSRCSSPAPHSVPQNISSQAFQQRDGRFNSRTSRPNLAMLNAHRHHSITVLTADFQAQHLLDSPSDISSSTSPYSNVSTPTTDLSDVDIDEGFAEPEDTLPIPSSDSRMFEPSFWALSMAELTHPTSFPSDQGPIPSFALRRRQRQSLSRLQCLTKQAPTLAKLVEECHPSSLPVMKSGRAKSISGGSGRIEKERSSGSSAGMVKRFPRITKRNTR